MTTETKTYSVPADNAETLAAKIERISRRCVKLGLAPVEMVKVGEEDIAFVSRWEQGERVLFRASEENLAGKGLWDGDKIVYRRYNTYTLAGVTPRLAGWEFVATLQHFTDDAGKFMNVLRTVPGFEGDLPARFRDADPQNCDHCHTRRVRKDTYVVRSTETGEFKQIGRNCVQDFVGGQDPHAIISALTAIQSAIACMTDAEEGGYGYGGGGTWRYGMVEFLNWVAACVRLDGWFSRTKARETGSLATVDDAFDYAFPTPAMLNRPGFTQERDAHAPTEADIAMAGRALEHVREVLGERDDLTDYLHNLRVICLQSTVDQRSMGIAGSVIAWYRREVEKSLQREQEAKAGATSTYLGTEGERLFVDVQVLKVMTIGEFSPYGPKQLHKLVTPGGHLLTWFSTASESLEVGKTYAVKLTVKKHEEYQGTKQTIVSRVAVYNEEGARIEREKMAKAAARAAKKAAKAAKEA